MLIKNICKKCYTVSGFYALDVKWLTFFFFREKCFNIAEFISEVSIEPCSDEKQVFPI